MMLISNTLERVVVVYQIKILIQMANQTVWIHAQQLSLMKVILTGIT